MSWQPGIYTVFAGVAATIFAGLAVVGWRRSRATATSFAWLMVGGLLWAVSYGIQLGFDGRAEQLLWQRATLVASATVPPLLLIFALRYAGRGDRITRALLAVLVAEFAAFATLTITNPAHHLVWTAAALSTQGSHPVLDLTFGLGYYLHIAYSYTVVVVALAVIFAVFVQGISIYQKQAGILLLGAIPALLSHVTYTLKLSPIPGLDLTPFTFTVTGTFYGLALFHFDLLDRTPVAQRRALELVGDGLLVVDVDGFVVDSNAVARQVYGQDVTETKFPRATGVSSPEEMNGTTETAVVDGTHRVYDCLVSRLHDDQESATGHVIVLRDVTERNDSEQRLEVANRVLRHNLRNDMNVILGYADVLADTAETDEQQRMAGTIHETAEGLVSVSEKLRQAVALQQDHQRATVDASVVVTRVLAEFCEEYPTVAFELDVPAGAPVTGVTEQALAHAVRNLVENAVEHNEPDELRVDVSVQVSEKRTAIRVNDTGSGLPEIERTVLETGAETPLQHGSGVGLWLVYWTAHAAGGTISVDTDETGTTVTIELPSDGSTPSQSVADLSWASSSGD